MKKSVANDEIPKLNAEIGRLKDKINLLEGIQSAMPDPYYVRDMDYNIIVWPAAIAKLTGYSEFEAKKMKCHEMFKACVCPPNASCPTQECIKARNFLRDVAVDVYHRSGKVIHTFVSNAGVYSESGEPIGAVEIIKDNTLIQNSMESIGDIIKEIETSSESLSTISKHVSGISERLSGTAQETMLGTKNGVQASTETNQKVEHSIRYADEVQLKMQKINESMKIFTDKLSELEKKSDNIITSVSIIQDIASETDLLAINAAIQAVHAGEAGKGFKVVAEGIKELSQNSSEAAQAITATVQEIIGLVKETSSALGGAEKDIKTGTENISELLNFIGDIDLAVKGLSSTMSSIEERAGLTNDLGSEQNRVAGEIDKSSHQMHEISKQLTSGFADVINAIKHTDMG